MYEPRGATVQQPSSCEPWRATTELLNGPTEHRAEKFAISLDRGSGNFNTLTSISSLTLRFNLYFPLPISLCVKASYLCCPANNTAARRGV